MTRTTRLHNLALWLAVRLAALPLLAGLVALAGSSLALAAPALPQPASPEVVAKLVAHPPSGFEIVDIRPGAEYADYSLPGSLNLDPATVMADETLLSGAGPLLIVDKDGTSAFAVAGWLAARTSRPVMALTGGLAAWWRAQEADAALKPAPKPEAPSAPKNAGN